MKNHHPYVATWARVRRLHVRGFLEAQTPTEKSPGARYQGTVGHAAAASHATDHPSLAPYVA